MSDDKKPVNKDNDQGPTPKNIPMSTAHEFAVEPKPKKFALLGYEVGGWGALLAFIISVITLGLTAVDRWMMTSNPIALPPEQINIVCQRHDGEICEADSSLFVTAVPIILLNDTAAPHSFTAISSDVLLEALNTSGTKLKAVSLAWQYVGDPTKPIGAITVPPQGNSSNEIQYHPRRTFDAQGNLITENFWLYADFLEFVAQNDVTQLRFTFTFNLLAAKPEKTISTSCIVPLDPDFKANAKLGSFVMFSRECFQNE